VTFTNVHTAGSYCAPSRAAIFTGRHASTAGSYRTGAYFVHHPDVIPLQKVFQDNGYTTLGAGKLFHHPAGQLDLRGWDQYFSRSPKIKVTGWPVDPWKLDGHLMPQPYPNSTYHKTGPPTTAPWFMESGAVEDEHRELMGDTQRVQWATRFLQMEHDKPLFLAVGLYAPHFANYVPQKYFDLYERESIQPPQNTGFIKIFRPEFLRLPQRYQT